MATMSRSCVYLFLLISMARLSLQGVQDNKADTDDLSPFAEAASAFFQDGNGADNLGAVGGLISNFIQSGGGKQIGDMLMGAATNNGAATGQILAGIGTLLSSQTSGGGGGGGGGGLDPALLSNMISMFADSAMGGGGQGGQGGHDSAPSNKRRNAPRGDDGGAGFDISSVLGLIGSFAGQNSENAEGVMTYLPMIMNTLGSFMGPEAEQRAHEHAGHAWFLPPVLEKVHLMFDHFMHSEMGRSLFKTIGAEKFVNTFRDNEGRFDFNKFTELLENQNFRRHWIRLVTNRIADVVIYIADPKVYKKYMSTGQYFVNNFLMARGYPKSALFDPARPTETLSALVNHAVKKYLKTSVDSKQYVKPAVSYIQEVIQLGQKKGFLSGSGDSRALSHKLTDTLNLEIIEPLARVYRAYRFAKKNPKCDKYVFCLVNQQDPSEELSLPGLKYLLSRSTSAFAVWFLSGHTNTPFWSLYHMVTEEVNCKQSYLDQCHDFHLEEVKTTTEYVHNEL